MAGGQTTEARIKLTPILATSPSTFEKMRECLLQAAFAHTATSYEFVLGNPLAWLGIAYHEVLAKVHSRRTEQPAADGAIACLWETAIARLRSKAQAHPLNRRFGDPQSWPRYFASAAITSIRAREALGNVHAGQSPIENATSSPLLEHPLTAFDGKLVGRPDAVRNRDVIDYKTGSLFDEGDGPLPPPPKQSYVRQLRIYAVLVHQHYGWWPRRGLLIPMIGASVEIEISPEECIEEARDALALLDRYNDQVQRPGRPEELASPSIEACKLCSFKLLCNAFWESVGPAWQGMLEGRVIEGVVPDAPNAIQGGAAFSLAIDVQAGTEVPGRIAVAPLSPLLHECIGRIRSGDRVRVVGLWRRADGSLASNVRTVVVRTEELPTVTTAAAERGQTTTNPVMIHP